VLAVVPAAGICGTVTWDGGGGDDYWQTDANWGGDTKPVANDVLVFAGTTRTSASNDYPASTQFNGIQFTNTIAGQGFTLAGNGINLLGDITNSPAVSNIADTIELDVQILAGQRFVILGSNHNLTVSGSISGEGRLIKVGEGTLTLSSSNSYSGGTHGYGGTAIGDHFSAQAPREGGAVVITDNNALGSRSVTFEKGGTLSLGVDGMTIPNTVFFSNWDGGEKIVELDLAGANSGTFAGNMDYRFGLGAGIKYNVGNQDTLTLSGNGYSGAGGAGFTKVGSGTLVITGTNTYKNTTTISAGTLQLGDGGATGTLPGNRAIVNNGTLVFNRTNVVIQGVDFGGPISGSGMIRRTQSNTVVLTAANTFTGGTVIGDYTTATPGGVLEVRSNDALGTGGVTFNWAGTVAIGANGIDIGNKMLWYNWGGPAIRKMLLDLSGTNSCTFSGGMDIRSSSENQFEVGTNDTLTCSGALGNEHVSHVDAGIRKHGAGTLVLTGANTYRGVTKVWDGTLLVNNTSGSGTGTGAVRAEDGGALGGTGSITGAVTIAGGGHLASGVAGAGTLTLWGGLTLGDGAGLDIAMDQGGPVGQIEVTGGTFTGASTGSVAVNLELTSLPQIGQYTIMDWSAVTASGVDSSDFVVSPPYTGVFQVRVVDKTLVLSRGATVLIVR